MKLIFIAEAKLSGSKTAVRDAAEAMGDLIQFIYELGKSPELTSLENFLKAPNSREWDRTRWVIDSALQKATTMGNDYQSRMKTWASLKTLTSPVATAAVYDVNQKSAKGTPLQKVALNNSTRNKLKMALGPQGYVSSLANASDVPPSKLKDMLKDTAKSGNALAKASKKDLPGIRLVTRF